MEFLIALIEAALLLRSFYHRGKNTELLLRDRVSLNAGAKIKSLWRK